MTDKNSVLTEQDFSALHSDFKNAPKSDVLSKIIEQNGINQAAQDPDVQSTIESSIFSGPPDRFGDQPKAKRSLLAVFFGEYFTAPVCCQI